MVKLKRDTLGGILINRLRTRLESVPLIGLVLGRIQNEPRQRPHSSSFPGTSAYWESRYAAGRDSGSGSREHLAKFKAEFVNGFVKNNNVSSVIEFGCGDGQQLSLSNYPQYIGLDVSRSAIALCRHKFCHDRSKSFYLYESTCFIDHARLFHADLALSMDVIFHLIETEIFENYMHHLFEAADRFVIVYSSDFDAPQSGHEKRRCFTAWVRKNRPHWRLLKTVKNAFAYDQDDPETTSLSDFYIFEKISLPTGGG